MMTLIKLVFAVLAIILILLSKITKKKSLSNSNRMFELLALMIFVILMYVLLSIFIIFKGFYLKLNDNERLYLLQKIIPLLGILAAICIVNFTYKKLIKKVLNMREKKSDYIKTKATVNSIELNNEFKDDMRVPPNKKVQAHLRVMYNIEGKEYKDIKLNITVKNIELTKIEEEKRIEVFISKINHRNIYYEMSF